MERKRLEEYVDQHLDDGKKERSAWLFWISLITKTRIKDGEADESVRIAAVERVLAASSLESIDDWDDQTAGQVVDYLTEIGYGNELKIWIEDELRLKLDPERVEEAERIVKKRFLDP